ncbi:MBL fold metallo-hydrolase [Streptosporangium lutulentum]
MEHPARRGRLGPGVSQRHLSRSARRLRPLPSGRHRTDAPGPHRRRTATPRQPPAGLRRQHRADRKRRAAGPLGGEHRIDDTLRLESAPGHTPGSSVVWLESRDARAVFVGDLMHSPVQILHPGYKSCFDLDAETARASRRRVLAAAARTGATVFPAHFGGHGAVTVQPGPGPDAFAVSWANLAPEAGDLG